MLVLGSVEQLAQDAVVQVDDFVGDRSHALDGQRYETGIAPLWLELGQVGGCHLAALAGNLKQPVLMNEPFNAGWQIERLPCLEAFNVFEHVAGVRFGGRLPQPGQPSGLAVVAALQQVIEAMPVPVRQRLGQGFVDSPVGTSDSLGTGTFDGVKRRQDD